MKRNHSIVKMVAAVCAILVSVTSCLKEDTNKTRQFSGLFTILGSNPSYRLLDDAGNIFWPTAESVNTLTNNKGFGANERVHLYGSYDESNVKTNADSTHTISNAILQGGTIIPTLNVLSVEEAKEANILSNDSIFDIKRFNNCWIANGYLNTAFNGQYSATDKGNIAPSTNIMLNKDAISENSISFVLLYNRHSVKTVTAAGSADFVQSFRVSDIAIPGNDSVLVQITAQGVSPVKLKVARKYFKSVR